MKLSHKALLDHHQYNKDPTLAEHYEQQSEHSQSHKKQQKTATQTKNSTKTYPKTHQAHKLSTFTSTPLKECIVSSEDLLDETFRGVPLPNIRSNHPLLEGSVDLDDAGNLEEVVEEVEDVETTSQIVTINTEQHEPKMTQNENIEQQHSKEPAERTGGTQKTSEFDIFGNFIAEVMKNMKRSKARVLQIKILNFISEFEEPE